MWRNMMDLAVSTASLEYGQEPSCDSLVLSEKDVCNVVAIVPSGDGIKAKKRKKVQIVVEDQMTPLLSSTYNGYNRMVTNCNACKCHGSENEKTFEEIQIVTTDTEGRVTSRPIKVRRVQAPSRNTSTSPPPGQWPLKRLQRVGSRDNPFLPGGELQKEADDILKRAKVIRDTFYLKDNNVQSQPSPKSSPAHEDQSIEETEENISPEVANKAEVSPRETNKPKENGKLDESATPENVKLDIPRDHIDGNVISDDTNKDKKKQKKCCSVM